MRDLGCPIASRWCRSGTGMVPLGIQNEAVPIESPESSAVEDVVMNAQIDNALDPVKCVGMETVWALNWTLSTCAGEIRQRRCSRY